MDTGSAHTAFPCQGCKCGKHMDPFFDPAKSNSSIVPKCSGKRRCEFKQGYTEGSSWTAYRVKDTLWMGEPALTGNPRAAQLQTSFEFGCLTSETGLFRTQSVDGIMGMSLASETLPHQLAREGIIPSPAFSMCFRVGGGMLTLGGVDSRLHRPGPEGRLYFARLTKDKGWFTVRLLDVLLKSAASGELQTIGASAETYNSGKGAIVDSGTTDTYLPAAAKKSFDKVFLAVAGRKYQANVPQRLSPSELRALPTIVYRLQAANGSIDVESPPTAYAERLPNGQVAFRVYLTEARGSVLGANFMDGHNVLFDAPRRRIGFAAASCQLSGGAGAAATSAAAASAPFANPCETQLLSACSAQCPRLRERQPVLVEGRQTWSRNPSVLSCGQAESSEPCRVWCSGGKPTRSNSTCGVAWTGCSASCAQSRLSPGADGACDSQRRQCLSGECPLRAGDVVVTLDLRMPALRSADWSEAREDELLRGVAAAAGLPEEQLHIEGPAPMVRTGGKGLKLQIKARVGSSAGAGAAQALLQRARSEGFLQAVAERVNGAAVDSGEGRWLVATEVALFNAAASRPAREEGSLQEDVARLFGSSRAKRNGTAVNMLRRNESDIFYRSDTAGTRVVVSQAAGGAEQVALSDFGYLAAPTAGAVLVLLLALCLCWRGGCGKTRHKARGRGGGHGAE